ncbi:MAG: hypothetical protein A3F83_04870 [Candidatus Glassbacteria bacterium RIFCSPLOWO2_12_FULL_58_11]|uniref:Rhamnogalacturonan lyase domain-containing protein n=1 Tax=Candidatus Glassbacteria bacterium RIFCSPLOWO2_12_FULL_58_11 TaxID=1817867 RepID=A0A1F5YZX0_9BACT|nr:MAG: hypothetical protein A3F83_04870 [Candidatus Glassbacteria bacterium RIFCSPLOWO2_12_FULL_58_11]
MRNLIIIPLVILLCAGPLRAARLHGKVSLQQAEAKAPLSAYSRGVYVPGALDKKPAEGNPEGKEPKVIVWAEPVGAAPKFVQPAEKPRMIQQNKEFIPSVLAVQTGTTIGFPNLDPLYHNVFSYSKAKRFDLGRYQQGKSKDITFDQPGVVEVYCEIHENMHAYIMVIDTPYFTKTGKNGEFTLELPGGKYKVYAWIPNSKSEPAEVELSATGDTEVNFAF